MLPRAALAALAMAVLPVASAQSQESPTRYSLAGGCYTVNGPSGQPIAGAERVRMQATTLGRYLLYLPDRTFVAAQSDGTVEPAPAPSPAADWRVARRRRRHVHALAGVGRRAGARRRRHACAGGERRPRHLRRAEGCAVYPEAALNAKRPAPRVGRGLPRRVKGLLEGHMHWMTFEYFGGKLPLRPAVAPVRHRVRAARLLVDRGPAGRRARRSRTSSTTATRRSRTTRAATRS